MSCGLSPEDMKNEGLIGQEPHQIMAQTGAETFTNPEVVENTTVTRTGEEASEETKGV